MTYRFLKRRKTNHSWTYGNCCRDCLAQRRFLNGEIFYSVDNWVTESQDRPECLGKGRITEEEMMDALYPHPREANPYTLTEI